MRADLSFRQLSSDVAFGRSAGSHAEIVAAGFKAALGTGHLRVVIGIVVVLIGIVVLVMLERGRW